MCFIYSLLIKHWDFSDDFVQVNGKRITTVVTNYRLSYVKQLWDKNIEKQWNMKCDLINLCLFISNQVFFAVSRNEKLSISLVGNFDICMIMGKFCGANFLKIFFGNYRYKWNFKHFWDTFVSVSRPLVGSR